MLVRGEDRHGNVSPEPVPVPQTDLSPDALAGHRRLLAAMDEAAFADVDPAP